MNGLNRVSLLGNLGADPELRMTQSGQAVLNLRLATTESYMDKNQERKERTEWHSAVVWGKRAEGLHKILHKGDRLYLEGRMQTTKYQDRDGNDRYKTEVVALNVILCGGNKPGRTAASEDAEPMGDRQVGFTSGTDDDDIPF